jgi:hypothetical protein
MRFNLTPSWSAYWTKSKAEEELVEFKWKGPGLYVTKSEAILVVPDIEMKKTSSNPSYPSRYNIWFKTWGIDQKFWFYVYNDTAIVDTLEALGVIPKYEIQTQKTSPNR